MALGHVVTTKTTSVVSTTAARQFLGLYDPANVDSGAAVYVHVEEMWRILFRSFLNAAHEIVYIGSIFFTHKSMCYQEFASHELVHTRSTHALIRMFACNLQTFRLPLNCFIDTLLHTIRNTLSSHAQLARPTEPCSATSSRSTALCRCTTTTTHSLLPSP